MGDIGQQPQDDSAEQTDRYSRDLFQVIGLQFVKNVLEEQVRGQMPEYCEASTQTSPLLHGDNHLPTGHHQGRNGGAQHLQQQENASANANNYRAPTAYMYAPRPIVPCHPNLLSYGNNFGEPRPNAPWDNVNRGPVTSNSTFPSAQPANEHVNSPSGQTAHAGMSSSLPQQFVLEHDKENYAQSNFHQPGDFGRRLPRQLPRQAQQFGNARVRGGGGGRSLPSLPQAPVDRDEFDVNLFEADLFDQRSGNLVSLGLDMGSGYNSFNAVDSNAANVDSANLNAFDFGAFNSGAMDAGAFDSGAFNSGAMNAGFSDTGAMNMGSSGANGFDTGFDDMDGCNMGGMNAGSSGANGFNTGFDDMDGCNMGGMNMGYTDMSFNRGSENMNGVNMNAFDRGSMDPDMFNMERINGDAAKTRNFNSNFSNEDDSATLDSDTSYRQRYREFHLFDDNVDNNAITSSGVQYDVSSLPVQPSVEMPWSPDMSNPSFLAEHEQDLSNHNARGDDFNIEDDDNKENDENLAVKGSFDLSRGNQYNTTAFGVAPAVDEQQDLFPEPVLLRKLPPGGQEHQLQHLGDFRCGRGQLPQMQDPIGHQRGGQISPMQRQDNSRSGSGSEFQQMQDPIGGQRGGQVQQMQNPIAFYRGGQRGDEIPQMQRQDNSRSGSGSGSQFQPIQDPIGFKRGHRRGGQRGGEIPQMPRRDNSQLGGQYPQMQNPVGFQRDQVQETQKPIGFQRGDQPQQMQNAVGHQFPSQAPLEGAHYADDGHWLKIKALSYPMIPIPPRRKRLEQSASPCERRAKRIRSLNNRVSDFATSDDEDEDDEEADTDIDMMGPRR